jgi:hypothetical protein
MNHLLWIPVLLFNEINGCQSVDGSIEVDLKRRMFDRLDFRNVFESGEIA